LVERVSRRLKISDDKVNRCNEAFNAASLKLISYTRAIKGQHMCHVEPFISFSAFSNIVPHISETHHSVIGFAERQNKKKHIFWAGVTMGCAAKDTDLCQPQQRLRNPLHRVALVERDAAQPAQ
jgi:hypothetical protein